VNGSQEGITRDFRTANPGRNWLNRPMVQAIILLEQLKYDAGTIDLLISKRSQDTPIVAVLEIDHSLGSDGIVVTEKITTVEDLIGKKVAFARDDNEDCQ